MKLPQTALLALEGPFLVPFVDSGRSWFPLFDDRGEGKGDVRFIPLV